MDLTLDLADNKSRWNILGQKYGRFTVTDLEDKKDAFDLNPYTLWVADCDCGSKGVQVRARSLRYGLRNSCGCLQREAVRETTRLRAEARR